MSTTERAIAFRIFSDVFSKLEDPHDRERATELFKAAIVAETHEFAKRITEQLSAVINEMARTGKVGG